ncbi:MAG: hypothetical protein KDA65_05005 [Planctomycetaceae bacterium]|nr:hypothetical protein [Planctomycetaceae bacterium]
MARYLIVCSDLFFTSKVSGTAQMLGFVCESVMSGAKAESVLKEQDDIAGMVLDLTTPGLNLEALLGTASDELKSHTVAFGPHVEKEKFQQAQELGCAAIFARSQFTAQLPEILKQFLN